MRAPCEISRWYILPFVRKAIARALVEEYGLSQAKAARLLMLTDAAVSQYLSGRRGGSRIPDKPVAQEIAKAARRIARTQDEKVAQEEVCRLCKHLISCDYFGQGSKEACVRCE
ncbi:MAG: helix-turn-helix domain-containing protein [Candidatus Thermoplasmatota archaeon]